MTIKAYFLSFLILALPNMGTLALADWVPFERCTQRDSHCVFHWGTEGPLCYCRDTDRPPDAQPRSELLSEDFRDRVTFKVVRTQAWDPSQCLLQEVHSPSNPLMAVCPKITQVGDSATAERVCENYWDDPMMHAPKLRCRFENFQFERRYYDPSCPEVKRVPFCGEW